MREINEMTEAVEVIEEIRARGMLALFHGTRYRFETFEVDPMRSMSFSNCQLGIHVTSDPAVALEYADNDDPDDAVLIVEVPPGRYGQIGDRDLYIGLGEPGLAQIAEKEPGLDGLLADGIGYGDLRGAGLIFDASSVRVVARIPRVLVIEDLSRDVLIIGEASLLAAEGEKGLAWPGASMVEIDLSDMTHDADGMALYSLA